jgi:acyl-coenzyme A thioesterase PaaI-like protein
MPADKTPSRSRQSMDDALPRQSQGRSAASISACQVRLEALRAAEHSGCFMCSPVSVSGLKLRFKAQPDGVCAAFPCHEVFRGYPATLHGGVISALLDAAMTNALFAVGVVGVTAELTVRFLAPVALNRDGVVRASVERDAHPLFFLRAELEQDRKVMARATARFLVRRGR